MGKHIHFLTAIFRFINQFIPKKSNKIMFSSYPDYSDNSKAFYEYLSQNYKDYYELIWIVSCNEMVEKLNLLGIKAYNQWTIKGIISIMTSKFMVLTHGKFELFKSKKQICINLWHGMPLKKMGFLEESENISQEQLVMTKKASNKIDYMIATSNIMKYILSNCFYINPNKVIVSGQPRNDYLENSNGRENLQKVLKNVKVQSYSKVIMYIPTFKSGLGRVDSEVKDNKIIDILNFNYKQLEDFLEQKNYLLIIKLHPREESKFNQINNKYIKIIKTIDMNENLISLNEILNICDLLITDYSSVYFDFLLLEKPILFINTGDEQYRINRGFVFENIDTWRPGPKVNEFNNFKLEIERLIKDNRYFEKERNLINSLINEKKLNFSEEVFNSIFK